MLECDGKSCNVLKRFLTWSSVVTKIFPKLKQPTEFHLAIHTAAELSPESALHSSLVRYLGTRAKAGAVTGPQLRVDSPTRTPAPLLLHLAAHADYYTTNTSLMTDGLVVDVDISEF